MTHRPYRILTLNDILEKGLEIFGSAYEIGPNVSDPDAIIVRSAKVDTDKYPNLLTLARAGAGTDNISVKEATLKGIPVFNTPGENAIAVAEYVLKEMIAFARNEERARHLINELHFRRDDREITEIVEKNKRYFTGYELNGKTLAVIGLGNIGYRVANIAAILEMNVVWYDTEHSSGRVKENSRKLLSGIRMAESLEDALTGAQFITVHVPLEGNKNLIGAKELDFLGRPCFILNYSRPGICDEDAVLGFLEENPEAHYVSDFPNSKLLLFHHYEQIECTAHMGGNTFESMERCAIEAVRLLKNYLEYGNVEKAVNFPTIVKDLSSGTKTRLSVVNLDVPGMIAAISGVLSKSGINISHFVNESNGTIGYNLLDFDRDLPADIESRIHQLGKHILGVRTLKF